MRLLLTLLTAVGFLFSCSPFRQIERSARENVLNDVSLQTAHVGISVFEPATGKYWFNYQGDKYFVPASNTKLPTCYAAMKYLGDSLTGLEYVMEDSFLLFRGTGDPTLLHPDFTDQKVLRFLKNEHRQLMLAPSNFTDNRWGSGWGIGDITESYAPERSEIPVYGNILRIFRKGDTILSMPQLDPSQISTAHRVNWKIDFERPSLNENFFASVSANQNFTSQEIPFVTGRFMSALLLLMDTLKKEIRLPQTDIADKKWTRLYSRPTDSLLKPMMHHSDNFFAEQSLLMVSNQLLGVMNDRRVIDTLLKTDFKDLPQKPRWVDGSGLSRYNLFSPQDMVFILNKMRTDFGMDRIKNILATGNTGTLTNYYVAENGFFFAKTGTLSGVVALSGFLYTKKGRLLILSVLVNNHNATAAQVRRAVERFVEGIRNNY
jgi:D-alanyl-D-alanine carboxypeptidase/D-alanyl-D-alanine-endopeptidase (penicillin-binding protein 4)